MYPEVETALSIKFDTKIWYIKLEPKISKVCSSSNLFFSFFGKLHTPNESQTHNLTLHLILTRKGGAILNVIYQL